jgi:hypothetical protein
MQATTVAAGAAITGAAVSIAELGEINGPALIRCHIPSLTALAAGETVTLNIVRLDTGAVIGSGVFTNSGAGASAGGPLIAEAYVPQGAGYAVAAQIIGSVATGNWVATALAPVVMSQLP